MSESSLTVLYNRKYKNIIVKLRMTNRQGEPFFLSVKELQKLDRRKSAFSSVVPATKPVVKQEVQLEVSCLSRRKDQVGLG